MSGSLLIYVNQVWASNQAISIAGCVVWSFDCGVNVDVVACGWVSVVWLVSGVFLSWFWWMNVLMEGRMGLMWLFDMVPITGPLLSRKADCNLHVFCYCVRYVLINGWTVGWTIGLSTGLLLPVFVNSCAQSSCGQFLSQRGWFAVGKYVVTSVCPTVHDVCLLQVASANILILAAMEEVCHVDTLLRS